jgi:superfamily II DNA or RNA helicase
MEERFGFSLQELDSEKLEDFSLRVYSKTLPPRYAYITSLERLRIWKPLADLAPLMPQMDLVIVDEAHGMRNSTTRSHALGTLLSEIADNMVFLTATPVNLRQSDLFNLLDLLNPGEYGDPSTLSSRLEPNEILFRLSQQLTDSKFTGSDRIALLDKVANLRFGASVAMRPEYVLLRAIVGQDELGPREIVEARRHLADLNALSTSVTRTRKIEVDEGKALREAHTIPVRWTREESEFYVEYLRWCEERAAVSGSALHFAMQMPLRLASACLPAARDQVTGAGERAVRDEDGPAEGPAQSLVPPHEELLWAAEKLGDVDSKLVQLQTILSELVPKGKRILLFTFSRPTLAYLKAKLDGPYRVAVMHGGVPTLVRRKIMADFRAGAYDIVLANRVASEGLDFEFCSAIINYDLPWNPMEIEQRIGRIDRIGQAEEKILIYNFYSEETIDEAILLRVLERIGIFEGSIGALEPIIAASLKDLQEAMFDFSLSLEDRHRKSSQVLEAIEANRVGLEELAATEFLLSSDDVDVKGLEEDLLRTGKYVGQYELALLLADWAGNAGAKGVTLSPDGRSMIVKGNIEMAQSLRKLTSDGVRTAQDVQALVQAIGAELEVPLVLDQEMARTGGGDLLTSSHPLTLAALSVPQHRQARFAHAVLRAEDQDIPRGVYLVQLAVAEWNGIRPGREIWGAAVTEEGQSRPGLADALLAGLAMGQLSVGQVEASVALSDLVAVTSRELQSRQVERQEELRRQTEALLEARRTGLRLQHERKVGSLQDRLRTARERHSELVLRLTEAQLKRSNERFAAVMEELDLQRSPHLQSSPLAVCLLEVR